ncbi:MAG: tetratricopeptide repeat protein, partial [Planctomycetota bacterium]
MRWRALGSAAALVATALGAGAARGGEAPGADRGKADARVLDQIAALEQLLERREKQIDRMHKIVLAQQKALETVKALDNAQVELARLKKENLRLKHELRQHRLIVQRLKDIGVPINEIIFPTAALPPKPIHAKVIAVRPEVKLVMLSVGTDDGVKKGYRFTIYDGERYVGKVEVERPFGDMCSARILPDWTKEKIREGYDAATGLERRPPGDRAPKERGGEDVIEMREATEGDRGKPQRLFREGVDLFELRRYDEAVDRFREVLKLEPDSGDARRLLRAAKDRLARERNTPVRPVERSAKAIFTKVVAVRPEVNLVMLSVGSDDGVKTGYRFTITRGERRIGTVEVEKVFADMSSARIIEAWKDAIKEGDDAAVGLGGRLELRAPPGEAAPPAEKPVPPGERG